MQIYGVKPYIAVIWIEKSFLVPFDEIKSNDWDLSINRYKEIVYEEIEYAAPSEIIQEIESLDQERNQALSALKDLLNGK